MLKELGKAVGDLKEVGTMLGKLDDDLIKMIKADLEKNSNTIDLSDLDSQPDRYSKFVYMMNCLDCVLKEEVLTPEKRKKLISSRDILKDNINMRKTD